MEGTINGWWLNCIAATIVGQGMKLGEGSYGEPPLSVLPHHPVSMETRMEGKLEQAPPGLLPQAAGGRKSPGYFSSFPSCNRWWGLQSA